MPRPRKNTYSKEKPPFSYVALCAMAIHSSSSGMMSLNEIYRFIISTFPYYKNTTSKWRNSLRHNLSFNDCFVKIVQGTDNGNKRSYWSLHPKCGDMFQEGSLLRRKRRFVTRMRQTEDGRLSPEMIQESEQTSNEIEYSEERYSEERLVTKARHLEDGDIEEFDNYETGHGREQIEQNRSHLANIPLSRNDTVLSANNAKLKSSNFTIDNILKGSRSQKSNKSRPTIRHFVEQEVPKRHITYASPCSCNRSVQCCQDFGCYDSPVFQRHQEICYQQNLQRHVPKWLPLSNECSNFGFTTKRDSYTLHYKNCC